jgi:hypothetical protein
MAEADNTDTSDDEFGGSGALRSFGSQSAHYFLAGERRITLGENLGRDETLTRLAALGTLSRGAREGLGG